MILVISWTSLFHMISETTLASEDALLWFCVSLSFKGFDHLIVDCLRDL